VALGSRKERGRVKKGRKNKRNGGCSTCTAYGVTDAYNSKRHALAMGHKKLVFGDCF